MPQKSYREWSPDQVMLLPRSMRDWLPPGHLVHFVMDVVAELDLSAVERAIQEKDHRGERPWNPRMMVGLLFYGYCIGVCSSRRIERATFEDVGFRILAGDNHPDHSAIAEFRKNHLAALGALFLDILHLCQKAGMVKLGRVALDGTKVKANASKHKAMSYDHMKRRETELRAEIAGMLAEAGTADAAEDELYGRDRRGDELPNDLRRKQDRLRKILAAKRELEAEAKQARETELADRARAQEDPPAPPPAPEIPSHQVRHNAAGVPDDDAQRNFTDPDSRIMKSGKDFVQAYNAQIVVDEAEQVIVATAVSNQPADSRHLAAMIVAVEEGVGARPVQVLADAGYFSAENIKFMDNLGIDALVSVAREKHVLDRPEITTDPTPSAIPAQIGSKAAMRAQLSSVLGAAAYRRRKCIVEPVFGQIKGARGIRQFLLRGVESVRGEWEIICATHNLLKLFRFSARSALAAA